MGAATLLERQSELSRIGALVERTRGGDGGCLAVVGPAGIGKTEVLQQARALPAVAGLQVLAGRGGELERGMPFGAARQLLEPYLRRLPVDEQRRLLSGAASAACTALGFESADPAVPGDSSAVLHGLYWLCSGIAERQPTILILDDAHWADAPSLRWIDYVARRVPQLALSLVVAARPAEPGAQNDLVEVIVREPGTEVVTLPPLTEASVCTMVRRELPGAEEEFCRACHRATGGNPFLVRELITAAISDHVVPVAANAARVSHLGSSAIAHSVLSRLARQGAEAVAFAEAMAILGPETLLSDATDLARLTGDQGVEAADALRSADLIQVSARLDFVHPLVRSAVYNQLGPVRRSADHLRAARLLAAHGAASDQVALHLLSVLPARDRWVVWALRTAAQQALEAGAPDAAVRYLQRALDEPPDPPDRPPILHETGVALLPLDPAAAVERLRAALRLSDDPPFKTEVAVRLARALAHSDKPGEGVGMLERVVAEIGDEHPTLRLRLEAELLMWSAFWPEDPARVEHRQRLHRTAASLTGASLDARMILGSRAWDEIVRTGTVREALAFAAQAWQDGISFANFEMATHVSLVYMYADALDHARTAFSGAIRELRRLQWPVQIALAHAHRAHVELRQGALVDAEADARTSWELARQFGPAIPAWWYSVGSLILVLLARGHVGEADGVLTHQGLGEQLPDALVFPLPRVVRGQVRLAQGRLREGVEDLLAVGEWQEERGYTNPSWSPWAVLASPALKALGREREAVALGDEALDRARAFGAPWALGQALRAAGLAHDGSDRLHFLSESVAVLESSPARGEHATSLVELGAALRRAKLGAEARQRLREGLDAAERCGAAGLARRAEEELAAAGARPRRRLLSGPEALTASERRAAQLAADGLGNSAIAEVLFVTRKTVEKHLGNAYGKLGITSRNDLAAALNGTYPLGERGQKVG